MINDLTTGSVLKQLLTFAWPFVLSNLLQTVYNLVDMIVVGQYGGSIGLSGVSIGGEVLHFFTFVCMGFSTAGQILISQFVGIKNKAAISKMIGTMFTFILGIAIVLTIIGLTCTPIFLNWLNTPAESYSQALDYTIVCFAGLIFIFGYNTVSAILRGMGDSKRPLLFVGIAAVMNLVLDLVFVAGMDMGAKGAALATIIGQGFSFVASIIYLYIRRDSFGFDFARKSFAIDKLSLTSLLRLGIPMALQHSAISISALFVNSFINSYGVVASAITGVGQKLNMVTGVITMALSSAGSAMIGQNVGAGKYERVSGIIKYALILNCSFAFLLSFIMFFWPDAMFSIFSTEEAVLELAATYSTVVILNYFANAVRSPFMALINGLGHGRLALIIGLMDGIVARVGLAVLLGIVLNYGIWGFWYGSAIAGYVPALIGAVYFLSGKWKNFHTTALDAYKEPTETSSV